MIEVANLTKTFGEARAVDDVSFHVRAGETFAFLGPNGAGKTTTLHMLTTLVRPTAGTIRIDGIDSIREPREARRRIGMVFQDPTVDPELTAYENMDLHGVLYHMGRQTRARRIESLLKLFGLWGRHADAVRTFSGGMRRRLEIARGLLHTPRILFLDEATLGLDSQSRNQLWNHVRDLKASEGVTVFLTTHYMDEAERLADRVAIIDHGRIVAQGTPEELKTRAKATSLDQAFLALTTNAVSDGRVESDDQFHAIVRTLWQRRRR
jgi:ABC-2 type transport system ATP-binding protein